ncbi:hypothetical protein Ancab_019103 [Ancistrocladus abbreviatus]
MARVCGKRTKMARAEGKKVHIAIEQEYSRNKITEAELLLQVIRASAVDRAIDETQAKSFERSSMPLRASSILCKARTQIGMDRDIMLAQQKTPAVVGEPEETLETLAVQDPQIKKNKKSWANKVEEEEEELVNEVPGDGGQAGTYPPHQHEKQEVDYCRFTSDDMVPPELSKPDPRKECALKSMRRNRLQVFQDTASSAS